MGIGTQKILLRKERKEGICGQRRGCKGNESRDHFLKRESMCISLVQGEN
jgi:hypothetical protein